MFVILSLKIIFFFRVPEVNLVKEDEEDFPELL